MTQSPHPHFSIGAKSPVTARFFARLIAEGTSEVTGLVATVLDTPVPGDVATIDVYAPPPMVQTAMLMSSVATDLESVQEGLGERYVEDILRCSALAADYTSKGMPHQLASLIAASEIPSPASYIEGAGVDATTAMARIQAGRDACDAASKAAKAHFTESEVQAGRDAFVKCIQETFPEVVPLPCNCGDAYCEECS